MKSWKIALPSLITVLCTPLISLVGCNKKKEDIKPTDLEINVDSPLTIKTGEHKTLTCQVYPKEASQEVIWSTSDEKKAEIDDQGNIIGISEGNVFITAKCAGYPEIFTTITTTVEYQKVEPEDITLDKTILTTVLGKSKELHAQILPKGTKQEITWISSNPEIATVENGKITPLTEGTTKITAQCTENPKIYKECTLTISERSIWDQFVDPNNDKKIDEESNWKFLTELLDKGLTANDIINAIDDSVIVTGGFRDWDNEYVANVKINNQLHKVRLVGLDQDTIYETQKKATMTWEFIDLICDTNGQCLKTPWNVDNTNFNYTKSTVNNALNSAEDVTWYVGETSPTPSTIKDSVYTMISKGNIDLCKHIQTIARTSTTSPTSTIEKWVMSIFGAKIFLPTFANYYRNIDISIFDGQLSGEGCYDFPDEYLFYQKQMDIFSIWETTSILRKAGLDGNYQKYLVASPITSVDGIICMISSEAYVGRQKANDLGAIAPCFCLGSIAKEGE